MNRYLSLIKSKLPDCVFFEWENRGAAIGVEGWTCIVGEFCMQVWMKPQFRTDPSLDSWVGKITYHESGLLITDMDWGRPTSKVKREDLESYYREHLQGGGTDEQIPRSN